MFQQRDTICNRKVVDVVVERGDVKGFCGRLRADIAVLHLNPIIKIPLAKVLLRKCGDVLLKLYAKRRKRRIVFRGMSQVDPGAAANFEQTQRNFSCERLPNGFSLESFK